MVSGSYCCAEALRLGRLHDCGGGEYGLMAAVAALIPPEPAAVDEPMLGGLATRTPEAIRPGTFPQLSLTLRLVAVEPLELKQ